MYSVSFLFDFNETRIFLIFFAKQSKVKFHDNPFSGSPVVPSGQTDRETDGGQMDRQTDRNDMTKLLSAVTRTLLKFRPYATSVR